jgi:NAD(P)H-dependent flavin oxidoreductase YrpB (nitropropane dioxygenase family)
MGQSYEAALAATVSGARGRGAFSGTRNAATMLKEMLAELKRRLRLKSRLCSVALTFLIPQMEWNAQKTNNDYTRGNLSELMDVIIESGAVLFVSAIGVPPKGRR